jgi:hypothetical protein
MKASYLMAIILCLIATEAFSEEWKISGQLARAFGDTEETSLNDQISAMNLNASTTSNRDNRTSWQVNLTYQYQPDWGVGFGYVDLGEVNTRIEGESADIKTFLTTVSDVHPNTAEGAQIFASYKIPLGSETRISVQAGMFLWKSEYDLEAANESYRVEDDGTSLVVGLSAERSINDQLSLTFDLNRYDVDDEIIPVIGVGLSYQFKR